MSIKKDSQDDLALSKSIGTPEVKAYLGIDPVAERKLLRKLDFTLLPLFWLIYCTNFIDRTAIGLEKDLGMQGFDFNIALTVFYTSYMMIEVPSNLVLKRIGSVWIAYLVIGFGAVALGSAFMRSYAQLIVTRVFLGIAEGGTLAGLVYTLARFYRRRELVIRMAFFYGLAGSLSGAFGGLLASGLLAVDDFGPLQRWRKIFFIEGIITLGMGIALLFIMPEDPQTTKLLNEYERAIAIARINADAAVKKDGHKEKTTLKLVLRSFNIWTIVCAMGYLFTNISFQGLTLFMPTVINSLGNFTVIQSQLRTVPPYIVGAAYAILNCYMSWYLNSRGVAIVVCMLWQITGYAIAIGTRNPHARYAACFFSIMGGTSSAPLVGSSFPPSPSFIAKKQTNKFLTWGVDNAAPETMRAVATAFIPSIGALGSIIAVWSYLPFDAPDYHIGNSINLASAAFVIAFTILGMVYLRLENKKRDRGERDYRFEDKTQEDVQDLVTKLSNGQRFNMGGKVNAAALMFESGHDFIVKDSVIVNGTVQRTGLDLLLKYSIRDVFYDSDRRWPPPRCHYNSRQELRDMINDWGIGVSNGVSGTFLWMHGPFGVGKSAIAQSSAESLDLLNRLGASLFFSRPHSQNDPSRVFPSIAYQLALKLPSFRDTLDHLITQNPTLLTAARSVQFKELLVTPLQHIPPTVLKLLRGQVIILDGLDEIDGADAQCDIIAIIAASIREETTPFRWFILSRPEPHIQRVMRTNNISAYLHSLHVPVSSEDDHEILLFLTKKLEEIGAQHDLPDTWCTEAEIAALVKLTHGLWVYADTIIRFIGNPNSLGPISQLRLALLESVAKASRSESSIRRLPTASLDSLYKLILQQIPTQVVLTIRKILLLNKIFPPRESKDNHVLELANILGLTREEFYAACGFLQSVLFLRDFSYHGTVINFYHTSFMDYMEDPKRSQNECIYGNCLEELRQELLQRINNVHAHSPGKTPVVDITFPQSIPCPNDLFVAYHNLLISLFWLCDQDRHKISSTTASVLERVKFSDISRLLESSPFLGFDINHMNFRDNLPQEYRNQILRPSHNPLHYLLKKWDWRNVAGVKPFILGKGNNKLLCWQTEENNMSTKRESNDEKAADHFGTLELRNSGDVITDSYMIDPVAEKQLLRKLDLTLLPLFLLIYCANFIDRTAIGNAKIAEKDLGMKGFDFNIALTVFYISYIVIEVPSNLVLKCLGSVWIAYLVIAFGVVSLGSAFMKTYADLIVTRIFLGFAEGGTLAGLVYTLARFYRRKELVIRMGYFMGLSGSFAGAFGGLLASGLLAVNNFGPLKSWRKIFFIEGIITLGIGIALLFIMPDDPQTSRLLNNSECLLAIARVNADETVKKDGQKEKTTIRLILRSFNIWTCACAVGYIFTSISFQGLSLFLPTVINSLGHFTVIDAQLRTVPPYIVGAVFAILNCHLSWYLNSRGIAIIVCMLWQTVGYAINIGTINANARYAACFFNLMGATSSAPLFLTWGADNAAPDTMRAVTTAAIPAIGAAGALVGVWSYLPFDAPNYHIGNSINLAAAVFVIVFTPVGMLYLYLENKRRDRGDRDYRLKGTEEEIRDLGYKHPGFRYQL
ncbi:hypothetical protein NP233_g10318 [Leucocoprinus birnbaumii]|uniref:Nephrocystin 3-like N-terminal domain-containing protein n=1 Tax=Leucocoprinus birnbaumii TaxID=56174 RepID=A0AAD5YLF1_9AGAR|nr:hypothetical protein NP233_g10318 [Leucocoprinus birnbaumii]